MSSCPVPHSTSPRETGRWVLRPRVERPTRKGPCHVPAQKGHPPPPPRVPTPCPRPTSPREGTRLPSPPHAGGRA